jgi:hypothetical protein
MAAGIKSERWPGSNRNPRPDCLGIRTQPSVQLFSAFGDNQAAYEKNSPKLIDERGSFADKTISRAVE